MSTSARATNSHRHGRHSSRAESDAGAQQRGEKGVREMTGHRSFNGCGRRNEFGGGTRVSWDSDSETATRLSRPGSACRSCRYGAALHSVSSHCVDKLFARDASHAALASIIPAIRRSCIAEAERIECVFKRLRNIFVYTKSAKQGGLQP